MNGCRNILPVVAAVVAVLLALAACGHGGMAEQAARAAVDTVEAHYKAYDVNALRSDSQNIANAVDYYSCCGQSLKAQHDFAQALLCQSKVLEAIGQPKLTLEALKRAETVCPKDDHNLLGHILFKKAYLYACQYTDSIPLALYEAALHQFTLADNEEYQMICIGEMGVARASEKMDSADYYLEKASSKAKSLGKKWHHCRYLTKLAIHHYFLHNYAAAAQLSSHIINGCDSSDIADNGISVYTTAIDAFVKMNKIDSASHYLSIMPAPRDEVDSMNLYYTLSRLNEAQKDYKQSLHYNKLANDINDSIIINSLKLRLFGIETSYDYQLLENESLKWRFYLLLALMLLLCVAVLAIALVFFNRQKQTKLTNQELTIAQLKNDLELMKTVHVDNHKLQRTIQKQVETMVDFVNLAMSVRTGETQIKDFVRKVKSSITLDSEDQSFWADIQTYADSTHNNLISKIRQKFPQLKQSDLQLMGLMCCGLPTSSIMLCMGYNDIHSLYNKKRRVAQKLGTTETLDNFIKNYST